MKTILLLLSLAIGFAARAQLVELPLCQIDSQYTQPGLYPSYDSLPCFEQGKCTQTSVQFVNLDSIVYNGLDVRVDDFTITSVNNLPCGIKYESESIYFGQGYPIANKGRTCLWFGGVATDSVGVYQINITGNATLSSSLLPQPIVVAVNLNDHGYELYLRVVDSASTVCPAIDTAAGTLLASCVSGLASCTLDEFGYYCDTCGLISGIAKIDAINQFELFPNPANHSITISHNGNAPGRYEWQMLNTLGQVVGAGLLDTVIGSNNQIIDVNNLPVGVYILSITNGVQQLTKRFTVER